MSSECSDYFWEDILCKSNNLYFRKEITLHWFYRKWQHHYSNSWYLMSPLRVGINQIIAELFSQKVWRILTMVLKLHLNECVDLKNICKKLAASLVSQWGVVHLLTKSRCMTMHPASRVDLVHLQKWCRWLFGHNSSCLFIASLMCILLQTVGSSCHKIGSQ